MAMVEARRGQKSVAEVYLEHKISQSLFNCWRDKFLEAGRKALSDEAVKDATEALPIQIERLEKIIGQ